MLVGMVGSEVSTVGCPAIAIRLFLDENLWQFASPVTDRAIVKQGRVRESLYSGCRLSVLSEIASFRQLPELLIVN